MIGNFAVLFASGDIKLAPDCPLQDDIKADLASFATTTTAAGNQIITQSRSIGGHGDLGTALILGGFAPQCLQAGLPAQQSLRGWS